jgi:hypothetical protein
MDSGCKAHAGSSSDASESSCSSFFRLVGAGLALLALISSTG